jgi:hypothetical protein
MCAMIADAFGEQIKGKDEELTSKSEEIKAKNAEIAGHLQKLDEMKALLQSFIQEEEDEEYEGEEGAFKESLDGDGKKALETTVANCKTVAERRTATIAHVLNAAGIKTEGMEAPALKAAWQVCVANAKRINAAKKAVTKAPDTKVANADPDAKKHPVLTR